jgi:hypothetical protein
MGIDRACRSWTARRSPGEDPSSRAAPRRRELLAPPPAQGRLIGRPGELDSLYGAAYAACKDKLPDEARPPEKNR